MNSEKFQIPFLDLKSINQAHREEILSSLIRVLDSGWYILGEEVSRFEQNYAKHCQANYCIGVASGLDALSLTLRAMEIGPGDEVIVPSNTYIATWLAVTHVGATLVPVEPDEATFNIDPNRIEDAITPKTRAIIPVHLYGQPAELEDIRELAHRRGLRILEDAAQAHGAYYKGQPIGAHGDAVAWSFYPGKNLGALGDGGAITTNDSALAIRLRELRNYGSSVKYHNNQIGYNSRLDEMQAAVLNAKLQFLYTENRHRTSIAQHYHDNLHGLGLKLPHAPAHTTPAWHLYVIRHPKRAAIAESLSKTGVGTMIHYPIPPHLQSAYAFLGLSAGTFSIAERMHNDVLSLPIGPTQTIDQTNIVIENLKNSLLEVSE